ncbi:MAG: hypothetical protein RIR26_2144 [Pseudomonadota bacterium]|jgi:ElaB/YqjD/DUF883 family membrane-anchored ribosome-binding protein
MTPRDDQDSKTRQLSDAQRAFEEEFNTFSESAELILTNLAKSDTPFAEERAAHIYARVEKALASVEVATLEYRIYKTDKLLEKANSLVDTEYEDDHRFVSEHDSSDLESLFDFNKNLERFNQKQRDFRSSEESLERVKIGLAEIRAFGEQLQGELEVAKGNSVEQPKIFGSNSKVSSESESERLGELQIQKSHARRDLDLLKEDLNAVRTTLALLKSRNPKNLSELRLRELKMIREARTRLSRRKNAAQRNGLEKIESGDGVPAQSNG